MQENGTCAMCGAAYTMYGHNPEPLMAFEDRVCQDCNDLVVVPERLVRMGLGRSQAVETGMAVRKMNAEYAKGRLAVQPPQSNQTSTEVETS